MSEGVRRLAIGEVARRTGMSASRIRYYEARGLLPEPERVAGKRMYGEDVFRRLTIIDAAQRVGFRLVEIRDLLGSRDEVAHERLRQLALVSQARFHHGGVVRLPAHPSPAVARPHRRSGSFNGRLSALVDAEADASSARTQAHEFSAPLLARLHELIERVRECVDPPPELGVEMLSRGLAAIPPADRARKAGDPTYESEYDAGEMLILTSQTPQVQFVAGVGLQALTANRLRFHAVFSTNEIGSPEGETETWRFRRESQQDLAVGERLINEMAEVMLKELPEALNAFNALRSNRKQ